MIPATSNYQTALREFSGGQFGGGPLIFLVTIQGYSRVFTSYPTGVSGQFDWLLGIDDHTTTINDLDGGADNEELTFTVQDNGGGITHDMASFTFEGKQVTLQQGFVGMAQADFITLWTGYVDRVNSANANLEYQFVCGDISLKIQQPVFATGDNGLPTSSSNPKTLAGHPCDLIQSILITQLGISSSLVDVARLNAYKAGPFSGMWFEFHLTQAPKADEFIKAQLMKPMGGYMWVNSQGKISFNFFYPLAGAAALATLGPDSWVDVPLAEQADLVNVVQYQFDKDDKASGGSSSGQTTAGSGNSGNYMSQNTELDNTSITNYDGQTSELVIQADGVRSVFQGWFLSRFVATMIFARYGTKNLMFDTNAADALWSACRLEPGDIVAVTHPLIPDRKAGVIGITGKLFEVLDRKFNFAEGKVTFKLLDSSYVQTFGLFQWAPDGEADYVPAGSTDQAKYMFMANNSDQYSNGHAANVLG